MSWNHHFGVRHVKAVRKWRQCQHCLQPLEVGRPALVSSGIFEGEFCSNSMHTFCSDAITAADLDPEYSCWLHELDDEQLDELQADHWVAVGMVKRSRAQRRQNQGRA